ncbi:MAG: orotidine 5'-phosphate decarboxylase [Candidatus Levybacteria bacterium RIFCSPLOWO2_01_FULL_39_24]|nr:MAG: orotidine 5'-phosphate decarboxylase [Candidatus Levybacteria bacterium RIFCSPHIGHO2_01_FULL_40_16]OGH27765.1 MAG: orotidine 5'-phosphate decarboxylase [Candidatus Levybacteria bacterium RIFCSPHIGHO2_12_FULL_39_9]OGH46419.1 MAG: orotidine 5'-phosphate decarboxylase [Candidatus Levybacteria bacterium RIFCSPLOWO2_01_FULL_39_24]
MTFKQKLANIIRKNNSLLCIGLDPDLDKIPKHILKKKNPIFEFNKKIIDETSDLVCCYKTQFAFYASHGIPGIKALIRTIKYIHLKHPSIPVILDAKRGDIGSTATQYAKEVFDVYLADAVTVNPFLGFDSLKPFLERKDKGIIILARTSNPGAGDFQDLIINKKPLYIKVAEKVTVWNEIYKNCLMVVGATWPEQLRKVRKIAPEMFFLIPGIGAQGGDLEKTLQVGLTKNKSGLIISSSREIIFSANPRLEALKLIEEINKYR